MKTILKSLNQKRLLKVLKQGLYTTIQDLGRPGYREYGVPVSGAMDQNAAKKANLLLNNNPNDSVIECTQNGPKLLFTLPTQIAICGADIFARLNNEPIKLNSSIIIKQGDLLSFGKLLYGFRAYIAVKDGFKTNKILGSHSFYKPITPNNTLLKDDEISYKGFESLTNNPNSSVAADDLHFSNKIIKVYKGPEFEFLEKAQQNFLLNTSFHIAINNRMAYQIKEVLPNKLPSILTSAILPGTVQLTPSGKIIVLMRDAQTTGGYPRILNLNEASINMLAQKRLGDEIRFSLK